MYKNSFTKHTFRILILIIDFSYDKKGKKGS